MRYLIAILMSVISITVSAQEEPILFEDPVNTDTLTTPAEPIGGYKGLLNRLQSQINAGDTVGKKFSLHLYNVGLRVNRLGIVDSTYIGVNQLITVLTKSHNALRPKASHVTNLRLKNA